MKSREEYIEKLAAQLKEWSTRIDELEAKARAARDDAKTGYENEVRHLKDQRDAAKQKLQELKGASTEAWDVLKTGAETAWTELKNAVASAKEKFNKPGGPN